MKSLYLSAALLSLFLILQGCKSTSETTKSSPPTRTEKTFNSGSVKIVDDSRLNAGEVTGEAAMTMSEYKKIDELAKQKAGYYCTRKELTEKSQMQPPPDDLQTITSRINKLTLQMEEVDKTRQRLYPDKVRTELFEKAYQDHIEASCP